MGVYASSTSLEILMIGTNFDTATTSLATKCIAQAENEVNKYLSKRYDIGGIVSAVPPIVTSLTEKLAVGYMFQYMSRGGKESMQRGKFFIDDALTNLKAIANYELDLIDSNGDVVVNLSASGYDIQSTTQNYSPTFNEDDQTLWEVDQLKLDDIKSLRETNE